MRPITVGASAELVVIFGVFGLFSGSLWGRKAWGVWWQWDPRVTMATMLVLVFLGYLMVRKYGGPGSEKLAAAMGIFGAATAPFVYKSTDWWRNIHPPTSVVRTLGEKFPAAWDLVLFCSVAFLLLFVVTLIARVRLEALPDNVVYMPKPWLALDVLMQAEHAADRARERRAVA